jgi:integral membrane protein (TIGR01906 family)
VSPLSRLLVVAETVAVALLFTVVLLGTMVGLVAAPGVTSALVRANRTWIYTGMTPDATVRLADGVRSWVTSRPEDAERAAREAMKAFAPDEVSHLADVRSVMNGARIATGIAAGILAVWLVVCLVFRRWQRLRTGIAAGGLTAVALVAVVGVAAFFDFSAAFSAFHGLFFAAGTWEFPAESLLIRVFPGSFWASAGALWGALVAAGGLVLFGASRLLPRDDDEAQGLSDEREAYRKAAAAGAGRAASGQK